jgi:FkbM family methyltransferase
MVVFDVGANIGFYTSLFADLVGPTGRVHSFEPDPLSFGILKHRTARRGNVTANQAAVGDRSGSITLFCNRSNRADNRVHASLGEETAETVEVPLTTLDDYCDAAKIDRIDAVKMDIQGAEVAALRGFQRILVRTAPRWLLIEFSPEHLRAAGPGPEDFWAVLDELGYEPWAFGDDGMPFRIDDREAFAQRYKAGYTDIWARRRVPILRVGELGSRSEPQPERLAGDCAPSHSQARFPGAV